METSEGASDEESIGVRVAVKELDDVLFRDVGNKIANDGRYVHIHWCVRIIYFVNVCQLCVCYQCVGIAVLLCLYCT